MRTHKLNTATTLLAAIYCYCVAASAGAQQIGAGNGIPNDELDIQGGPRLNVDRSNPAILAAGTYMATLFNFDAGMAGDVRPFLAVSTGTNQYQAIAVGNTNVFAAAMLDATLPFGGAAVFTLAAPTTVFAGITSSTNNPIFLDNLAGLTDHEGNGQPASSYLVTLGATIPADGSFSNPNLNRTYAFSVAVAPIPEPSSIGLALLGGMGLLGIRRRAK